MGMHYTHRFNDIIIHPIPEEIITLYQDRSDYLRREYSDFGLDDYPELTG